MNAPSPPDFNHVDEVITWLRENAPQDMPIVGNYTMFDLCRDLEDCETDYDGGVSYD